MGRKSKTQTAVEDFEVQFEILVKEYLSDVNLIKAEDCFESPILFEAVCGVFEVPVDECEDEEDEE